MTNSNVARLRLLKIVKANTTLFQHCTIISQQPYAIDLVQAVDIRILFRHSFRKSPSLLALGHPRPLSFSKRTLLWTTILL